MHKTRGVAPRTCGTSQCLRDCAKGVSWTKMVGSHRTRVRATKTERRRLKPNHLKMSSEAKETRFRRENEGRGTWRAEDDEEGEEVSQRKP